MKYALVGGSLRKGSYNQKLLSLIQEIIINHSLGEVLAINQHDLNLPLYNQDVEDEGMPESVLKLHDLLKSADATIVCSPEYNGSISSPLKNTIDWVSRMKPDPFKGVPILLTGASPGRLGALRGIRHARAPFEAVGAFVFPQSFGLAKSHEAFSTSGKLLDSGSFERLTKLLIEFNQFAKKISKT